MDSSVTVLRTCCMAKLTKLSFDRSPLYFTAACWFREMSFFIFQRYPILGFNILNDAEVLLLNNSAFTNDTRRTPTVQIVQNPVSNTICNDFSSLPSLEVGKTDMRALYPTRQHLQYVVMYIKYGPEGFIKKYKMFMIN